MCIRVSGKSGWWENVATDRWEQIPATHHNNEGPLKKGVAGALLEFGRESLSAISA